MVPERIPETRSPDSALKPPRGVFYGWRLVGLAIFMLTLMAVTVFQGLGTFLVTVERQFGWSRTALSGAFSLARAQGAVLGPVEGYLILRLGIRRMVLIGYSVMGFGFILLSGIRHLYLFSFVPDVWPFSGVESLWHFYVTFIVITLGSGLGGWLAMTSLVNNWFIRRRSLAMATALSGLHFGGFLVPVLALGLESQGFRMTTFGIGVFVLVTAVPLTRVIRNRPEDYGLRPDGDPPPPRQATRATAVSGSGSRSEDEVDFTPTQALRTPVFWMLTVVHLSSTISVVTLALHLVPKLTDMGLSLSSAGVVVLTHTAIAVPAQFVAGYIADRVSKPPLLFVFLLLQAISVMVIAMAESVQMAYLFAVLYGIGFGGRSPLLTAIRGDYFGRKSFAMVMGLSQFPNNIVMIGAPLFAGYMFDTRGSYFIPFAAFAVFNLVGALLVLFVKKPEIAGSRRAATSSGA